MRPALCLFVPVYVDLCALFFLLLNFLLRFFSLRSLRVMLCFVFTCFMYGTRSRGEPNTGQDRSRWTETCEQAERLPRPCQVQRTFPSRSGLTPVRYPPLPAVPPPCTWIWSNNTSDGTHSAHDISKDNNYDPRYAQKYQQRSLQR